MTLYRSHRGAGQHEAKVLSIIGGVVNMEGWRIGGRAHFWFSLPAWFLSSPVCGWKEGAGE